MHDPAVVQERDAGCHAGQPFLDLFHRHAVRISRGHLVEAITGDILHDNPVVAIGVCADIENCHQVRVLQVQALRDAAEFDFEVVVEQLQRDFLAGVAERVVDLAEATAMNGPLDGVAIKRFRFWCEGEFHKPALVR